MTLAGPEYTYEIIIKKNLTYLYYTGLESQWLVDNQSHQPTFPSHTISTTPVQWVKSRQK